MPQFDVICVGLSEAGKTTLLSLLSKQDMTDISPTTGSSSILNVLEIKMLMRVDCESDFHAYLDSRWAGLPQIGVDSQLHYAVLNLLVGLGRAVDECICRRLTS